MKTIFKSTLKEFIKTPIALFFCFVPAIIALIIMIVFKIKNNLNFATLMISFEIFYITSLCLNGLCHHHYMRKQNNELKNISLCNISIPKYIIAIISLYYFLFFIVFVIVSIVFIILGWLTLIAFFYCFLASIVSFIFIGSIAFLITSYAKNIKSLSSISFIVFILICVLIYFRLGNNNYLKTILEVLPISSICYFFNNVVANANFNYLAFIFMNVYLIVFFVLTTKYFNWI